MSIQTIRLLAAASLTMLCLVQCPLRAHGGEPWTDKQLKDPAALAAALRDPKAPKPVIFNVGPEAQIKGAIQVGPTGVADNLKAFRRELGKLSKDQEVVIYCGCCPFRRCPNVRPAFELLKELKFANPKLLNLPTSLKEDWTSKDYPME
jgi:hypothetical protein